MTNIILHTGVNIDFKRTVFFWTEKDVNVELAFWTRLKPEHLIKNKSSGSFHTYNFTYPPPYQLVLETNVSFF